MSERSLYLKLEVNGVEFSVGPFGVYANNPLNGSPADAVDLQKREPWMHDILAKFRWSLDNGKLHDALFKLAGDLKREERWR